MLHFTGMNTLISTFKRDGRSVIAEAFGTAIFTAAVLVSLMTGSPAVIVAPVVLTFLAFTLMSVSGAHVNPAITLGALFAGVISWRRAVAYVLAQVVGAFVVLGVAHLIPALSQSGVLAQIAQQMSPTAGMPVALGEIVALAIFSFGVGAVMFGKVVDSAKPIVVGISLLVALIVTLAWGGTIANPAIALGLGVFSLARVLAPLLGSVIGFGIAKFLYNR